MFERSLLKRMSESSFKRKVIILIGARQVGKTTLLKSLIQQLDV